MYFFIFRPIALKGSCQHYYPDTDNDTYNTYKWTFSYIYIYENIYI